MTDANVAAAEPQRRGKRGPAIEHDQNTPAWRIIYGVFGSLSTFCEETGVPLGTAHLWLTTGIIPARRQLEVIRGADEHGRKFDRSLFVPVPLDS